MRNQEREQLFSEDFEAGKDDESSEDESLPVSSSEIAEDKEDCKVCGDSGPCSACDRGIMLAKEQGRAYHRKRR